MSDNRIEQVIDNRFKQIFSNEAFSQYAKLSPDNQQTLRDKFKEMFMAGGISPASKSSRKG